MKRTLATLAAAVLISLSAPARGVTLHAVGRPADAVFAEIVKQSGRNFVYPSGLLDGMKVTVSADNRPLDAVLRDMFADTDIAYSVRGSNILLYRRPARSVRRYTVSGFVREAGTGEALVGVPLSCGTARTSTNTAGFYALTIPAGTAVVAAEYPGFHSCDSTLTVTADRALDILLSPDSRMLDELVVHGSRNRTLAMDAPGIGNLNLSGSLIKSTPVLLGESDVIKTLQLEPGVSAGAEGMAGMYVHGGNADENLFMLDNVPLYQVNHLGGLFSAFNTEALRSVDFYKSGFPARYDGRLSSYVDVHTKDGSTEGHHGSAKLGLISAAFDINGPIWRDRTTYSFAIRRSWLDLLTRPICALVSSRTPDDKYSFGYAFTDINAKVNHRFSERSSAHVMLYFGDDYLRIRQEMDNDKPTGDYEILHNNLRWGNIVASAGWNYVFSRKLFGEFTAAYTRYRSTLEHRDELGDRVDGQITSYTDSRLKSTNNINDWIFRGDFDYTPHEAHKVNFGVSYTRHSFLPSRSVRRLRTEDFDATLSDNGTVYRANEVNAYISDDWTVNRNIRADVGLHASLFNISGNTSWGLSPRASVRWAPSEKWAFKAAYGRTVQYVHQLIETSLSLPTDQWVPVIGDQKPQTADKISAAAYFNLADRFTFSVEGYYKWMHNLLEYRDEYYLMPPSAPWDSKLTPGSGTAKGIDFKVSKEFGRVSGHVSYSLLWADRRYAELNGGKPFPARYDNRHKINVMVNWKISKKWEMSAAWTGMSGNRFTLATQCWTDPTLAPWHYDMSLKTDVNNYRLPFYHRLDLSFKRNTRRGYWTFSAFNAYCHMNPIAVERDYGDSSDGMHLVPKFRKLSILPIIPSVSYTWIF